MTEVELAAPWDAALNDQLSDAPGSLPAQIAEARAAIDRGEDVLVVHRVTDATYRGLADLVRWIDDTLQEVTGVRFVDDSARSATECEDFATWWRAAIEACTARELGFEVGTGLPSEPTAGLRPHRPEPVGDPHPEEVVTHPRPQDPGGWREALDTLTGTFGTLVRFVNIPQLVLDIPELLAHVEADVRDQGRMRRHAVDSPRVRIDVLGAPPADGLTEALEAASRAAGAEPTEGEAESRIALVTVTALTDFRGVMPLAVDDNALDQLGVTLRADGADHADPPGLSQPALTADLWLVDLQPLGLVVAACDPVPLDSFLLVLTRVGLQAAPWLPAGSRWVSPETRIPGGLVAPALMDHPEELERAARTRHKDKPFVVLGLACTTLANHAAALLIDGVPVAAVQEERLRRRKQLGWFPPGRKGVTVVADPTLPLEAAWPRRSMAFVLEAAGLTLDDVDVVAYNGVPGRWFPTYSLTEASQPPVTIRDGNRVFVPHHLAHAASTHRVSGHSDGFVFTVDGRGERETAAFFEVSDGGALERVFDIRCERDTLVGGVYEVITNILGFGHHGAGSTMGLACLGVPGMDVSAFLSARSRDDHSIHDRGIEEVFGHLSRHRDGPLLEEHFNLAASAQRALEDTVIALIADGLGGRAAPRMSLAGGVALNCSMNQRIRLHFGVEDLYVQPAANDAGTALGAALEAHWLVTGDNAPRMRDAYLGPGYSEARIDDALRRFELTADTPADLPQEVAQRIAAGQVVCWFQGRLEFGPRALGARSILADPRTEATRDRVNVLKGRQWWRPFGPSVLAGREHEWFETPMDSPFMLFTLPVRPEKRARIAAVTHVDGTTRPQSVTREANPRFHAVIEHFDRLTGVPMVVNTSFNTAYEPIVCTPEDAITSFLQLGADALAIGDRLVVR